MSDCEPRALSDVLGAEPSPERVHALGILTGPRRDAGLTLAGAAALARADARLPAGLRVRLDRFPMGLSEATARGAEPYASLEVRGGLRAVVGGIVRELDRFTSRGEPLARILIEATTNALVHRSLAPTDLLHPVVVRCFPDAVVVRSPGPPLPRIGLDPTKGPRAHFARNPRLAHLSVLLGLAKGRHTGTGLLRRRAREAGLRPAPFSSSEDAFTVVLLADPDVATDQLPARPGRRATSRRSPEEWDRLVLGALTEQGALPRARLEELLGASRSTLRDVLERLVRSGRVNQVGATGRSPNVRYAVVRTGAQRP